MALPLEQIKIAVCGHVDHGKSSLIGRLLLDCKSLPEDKAQELRKIASEFGDETQLAYLCDQLKEEREKNITIESTQIFLKTHKRSYCLIDTPGHLEFIKNMLSGTSQAEAALLIIDIIEGIQDQTRRHAHILKFLGLQQVIVLINKMDLVEYSQDFFSAVKKTIVDWFTQLGLKSNHIIPVSAKYGENISGKSRKMSWDKGSCLVSALDQLKSQEVDQNQPQTLRLPVQDIYSINGEEIIVGQIAAGILSQNQEIIIFPDMIKTKIKSLKLFNENRTTATAQENIGITLSTDIPGIRRGNVICSIEHPPHLINTFRGNIVWLNSQALEPGRIVQLSCATQTFHCKIKRILQRIDPKDPHLLEMNTHRVENNQAGIVEFELLDPAIIENFSTIPSLGRYTIEHNQQLLGMGTALDHDT